jgi:hypothetical protein
MIRNAERIVRVSTIITLAFMVCWGLVLVVAQIRPFWVDEWRVIYNLKFKDAATLWGPLDFMQQFPRVYLEIIKAFTSLFDYSYLTLRLPSYLVGAFTIVFSYRLMNGIYPKGHFNRFLFVMILISCSTFTEYFVQIKQYTMDMLLSLVALWQLTGLIRLGNGQAFKKSRYIGLCASFLVLPFFSYTYPVAVAPVFAIVFVQGIHLKKILWQQWFPLLLSAIAIVVFYVVDVRQLMADKGMHQYWGHLMMDGGFSWRSFFINFYNLFAEIGSGLVFWFIFGTLGTIVFFYGLYASAGDIYKKKLGDNELIRLYSVILVSLVVVLFITGKFPVGEPRLNAFTIPAISILLIYFLDVCAQYPRAAKFARVTAALLYISVIGNIYTTFIASVTGPVYAKKMDIYKSTEDAIVLAQAKKIPILITPEVAYPYDKTWNLPFQGTVPGDWVLKTFPAYKVAENIPVYAISDLAGLQKYMKQLPPYITSVMAGDGRSFRIIRR